MGLMPTITGADRIPALKFEGEAGSGADFAEG